MASLSDFLKLSLPAFNEFIDSWGDVNNQNFETVDDWLLGLRQALVGDSSPAINWTGLTGNLSSLSARLVAIDADGNIDLSGATELVGLSQSVVRGNFYELDGVTPSSRYRLEDSDFELHAANQPFADGRFANGDAGGAPTLAYPHENIDAAMAYRTRDFGTDTNHPMAAPQKPWGPGLVQGGDSAYVTAPATAGQVTLAFSGTAPAVFNIDGYLFRVREPILFDYSLIGAINNDWVWIYVSRDEASYDDENFKYSEPAGTPAKKDLRKLKTGTDGIAANPADPAGSTFTSASSAFDTAPWRVRPGDTLVIESGANQGSYVINTVAATVLTINGRFPSAIGGNTFHVLDNWMPNIGAVVAGTNTYDEPAYEPGRVYIGRIKHNSGGAGTSPKTWRRTGVYDSGWVTRSATQLLTGYDFDHDLGVIPSRVEVMCRVADTGRTHKPIVRRTYLVDFDTANTTVEGSDPKPQLLLAPSMFYDTDEVQLTLYTYNASPDANGGAEAVALFTDSAGADQASGEVRVICWR